METELAWWIARFALAFGPGALTFVLTYRGRSRLVRAAVEQIIAVLSLRLIESQPPQLPSRDQIGWLIETFADDNNVSLSAMPDPGKVLRRLGAKIQCDPFLQPTQKQELVAAVERGITALPPAAPPAVLALTQPAALGLLGALVVAAVVLLAASLLPENFVSRLDPGLLWVLTIAGIIVGLAALLSLLLTPGPPMPPTSPHLFGGARPMGGSSPSKERARKALDDE